MRIVVVSMLIFVGLLLLITLLYALIPAIFLFLVFKKVKLISLKKEKKAVEEKKDFSMLKEILFSKTANNFLKKDGTFKQGVN